MNWDLFLAKNEKKMYSIAVSYLRNREDALDCVQETMISVYKSYVNIKDEIELKKLLYTTLNNKMIDKYRYLKRFYNIFKENITDIEEEYVDQSCDIKIEKAFKGLSNIQQRVFLLKTIEEFTFKEISEILRISESTAKTHYNRGLEKIKNNIE